MEIFDKKPGDNEIIAFVNERIEEKKSERQPHEKQWLINRNFKEGNHYLRYNKQKGTIETAKQNDYDVTINVTKEKAKDMKSSLVSDELVFATKPDDETPESHEAAKVRNKWLMNVWEIIEGEKIRSEAIELALEQSYSVVWLNFTDDIEAEVEEAFDVYVDRIPVQKGEWVIRTGYVPLSYLKTATRTDADGNEVKVYKNTNGLKTGGQGYESEYKNRMLNLTNGTIESNKNRVKIREIFYKVYEDDDDPIVWVATLAENRVLRNEKTDFGFFPCALLPFDISPGQTSGFAWMRGIVDKNRVINRLFSSMDQYHGMAAKFRMVVDSTGKVSMVTNQNGQIIRIAPGSKFQQMPMNSYPSSAFNEADFLMERIEGLSVKDAASGRNPAGVKSGAHLDSLIAADARSNTDYRQAVKEFLKDLGEICIKMGAKYYKSTYKFNYDEEGETRQYSVIGEDPIRLDDEAESTGAVPLKEDTQVSVTVGSALGHTEKARQETALMLWDRQVITNKEFILKQFGIDPEQALEERQMEQGEYTSQDLEKKIAEKEAQGIDIENDPEVQGMIEQLEQQAA